MFKETKQSKVKYLLFFVIVVLAYFSIKDIFVKKMIQKEGKDIIVQFILKKRLPKTTNFYFAYVINKKKVTTANSGIKHSILNSTEEEKNIDSLKINNFYWAKLDPDHPYIIQVDPTKQVTDTVAIMNAGFTKNDIDLYKNGSHY